MKFFNWSEQPLEWTILGVFKVPLSVCVPVDYEEGMQAINTFINLYYTPGDQALMHPLGTGKLLISDLGYWNGWGVAMDSKQLNSDSGASKLNGFLNPEKSLSAKLIPAKNKFCPLKVWLNRFRPWIVLMTKARFDLLLSSRGSKTFHKYTQII